jgi:tRNA uridine 5-carbamoylmethylation protein Kti12
MLQDSDKTYEEIINYCEFADNLSKEIEKEDAVSPEEKEAILFPLIDELKEIGNKLIEQYIAFLKDKTNRQLAEELKKTLYLILEKIDYCKNKVYELYKDK